MSSFSLIDDIELTSAAAAITLSGIDTDYRRFRLTIYTVSGGTNTATWIRLNSDSGSNYAKQRVEANATTVGGARFTGQTAIQPINGGSLAANSSDIEVVEIEKPATGTPARWTSKSSYMNHTASAIVYEASSGEWNNTADLIDTITVVAIIASDFAIGTRVVLEGATLS